MAANKMITSTRGTDLFDNKNLGSELIGEVVKQTGQ